MRSKSDKDAIINNKSRYDAYFERIFHQFYSPLCNYALKITGNTEIAEDLVQNLFLQLYEKKVLLNILNPERYLLRSIKFKCIDYLRSKNTKREIQLEELKDDASERLSDISEEEIEPLLHYFAAKLPPKTREVFLLSRNSGLSYKEIAEELNISAKTVETQMSRALRQMKSILKSQNLLSLIPFL